MRLVAVLVAVLLATPAWAGRVCTQSIAVASATTFPSATGLDTSQFLPGLISANLDVESGTVAATLETQVGDSWVSLGTYSDTGKLKIDVEDTAIRLNVGTCTGCDATFTVCGQK